MSYCLSNALFLYPCRFELALQQNEIMNIFYDDWVSLSDTDSSFGNKADNHLKVKGFSPI